MCLKKKNEINVLLSSDQSASSVYCLSVTKTGYVTK